MSTFNIAKEKPGAKMVKVLGVKTSIPIDPPIRTDKERIYLTEAECKVCKMSGAKVVEIKNPGTDHETEEVMNIVIDDKPFVVADIDPATKEAIIKANMEKELAKPRPAMIPGTSTGAGFDDMLKRAKDKAPKFDKPPTVSPMGTPSNIVNNNSGKDIYEGLNDFGGAFGPGVAPGKKAATKVNEEKPTKVAPPTPEPPGAHSEPKSSLEGDAGKKKK